MYKLANKRLQQLQSNDGVKLLSQNTIGIEKESLRVNLSGHLAQTSHPTALGSALMNPYITTDYSEALIEIISPPLQQTSKVLNFLHQAHQYIHHHLDDEFLWPNSMPCILNGEANIPLAQYGPSNLGKMKTVYRNGLGLRYGREMQVIAGIHFNFSFADSFWQTFQQLEQNQQEKQTFISEQYFNLTRNLQRYGWLIPYLFGSSPAVSKSFLSCGHSTLDELDPHTLYQPYATSLRMGDIGYQNNKENETGVKACYDNLNAYVESLQQAINTPYPSYEKFGFIKNGDYQQLNANLLQIENEYYSTVRPKQILTKNEKPTLALKKRGVKYLELRSLDVNVDEPVGINESQLLFLETFLSFCLLQESPMISAKERLEIDHNEMTTAHQGRKPKLQLQRQQKSIKLSDWALELCEQMQGVSELLDTKYDNTVYSQSLSTQIKKIKQPELTPSAKILTEMCDNKESFFEHTYRKSQQHHQFFIQDKISTETLEFFSQQTQLSLQKQQLLEQNESQCFEEFLQQYFQQS